MKKREPLPSAVTELLTLCERLYLERCVLEVLLQESGVANWQDRYERVIQRTGLRAKVHAIFEDLVQQLLQAAGVEKAISALLRRLPTEGKPN